MILVFAVFVICIGYLIAGIICAIMESRVTTPYMMFGVYSRPFAYIFLIAFMCGVFFLLLPFAIPLTGNMLPPAKISKLITFATENLIVSAVFFLFSYFMYNGAKKKCPAKMQKKLLTSLLISGLGVAFKLCFFFIPGIWNLSGPSV